MSDDVNPSPLFYKPDPDQPRWIQGKPDRLERRGPCDFRIVGHTHDGRPAEARIVAMSFKMRGI